MSTKTPTQLRDESKQLFAEAKSVAEGGDFTKATEMMNQAKSLLNQAKSLQEFYDSAGAFEGGLTEILPDYSPDGDSTEDDQVKSAIWSIRDQEYEPAYQKLMKSVYGTDPRQLSLDQQEAFARYLRGKSATTILQKQYWSPRIVEDMIKSGMSVRDIKATMVEGTDILGGYAVPIEVGDRIIQRAAGLTAVRSGGATVVQTAGKSIEWLKIQGSGNKYPSGLRGTWGNETADPAEKNWTYGSQNIPVNTYTYKVPMSTSLLEDAVNIVDLFTGLVSTTMGIDEDQAFLVGSGNGQPYGILPNGTNARNLTRVASGSGTGITMDGVKRLKRGIASQYRLNGSSSFIGNGDTGLELELLKDAENRYFFESIDSGDAFMGGTWREAVDMPDVAASAFPLLHVQLDGYIIVERLGLSIQRYNDAKTGINRVEYHVRRRIGGDLMEPWKASVMEIAAS